ncbi:MAG: hypothetical protein ACRD8O_17110 [Bryobacteraceae bacterium]
MSTVRLTSVHGRDRKKTYGRPVEEYLADFCLISKRVLNDEEYRVFRFRYLLGADWKLCCRALNLDRGNFFHFIYGVQQKLGRAFRELEPYGLFPLDEYFGGTMQRVPAKVIEFPRPRPVYPPVKKTA